MDGTASSPGSESGSRLTPAQEDLLRLIGEPSNNRLRELHRMLTFYKYEADDLKMLHAEVLGAMSKRAIKRLSKSDDE